MLWGSDKNRKGERGTERGVEGMGSSFKGERSGTGGWSGDEGKEERRSVGYWWLQWRGDEAAT